MTNVASVPHERLDGNGGLAFQFSQLALPAVISAVIIDGSVQLSK
jgi:hypothetical protein